MPIFVLPGQSLDFYSVSLVVYRLPVSYSLYYFIIFISDRTNLFILLLKIILIILSSLNIHTNEKKQRLQFHAYIFAHVYTHIYTHKFFWGNYCDHIDSELKSLQYSLLTHENGYPFIYLCSLIFKIVLHSFCVEVLHIFLSLIPSCMIFLLL